MGEMSEIFKEKSKEILKNYHYKKIDDYFYKIGNFNYWPTTGLFMNITTGKVGRGINNLVPLIKEFKIKDNIEENNQNPDI